MNLALVYWRKIQIVKSLFFHDVCCSGNSWKILKYTKLICSQYTILTNTNISFCIEFLIKSGKLILGILWKSLQRLTVSAEQNTKTRRAITRLVFVFCSALTTGRCNVFQHIFGNENKSEFYGPNFQTMLFLVTMVQA